MIVFERRACAILYNLLRSRRDPRPWLLPANICIDVPATFLEAEQRFELIDIDASTLEIDVAACRERLRTQSFGGVVFARAYGAGGDRTSAFERLKDAQPDLFIIDDRCLSAPDPEFHERSPLAGATLFSTGRAKFADLAGGGFAHLADESYERHSSSFDHRALIEQMRRCKQATTHAAVFEGNVHGWLDLRAPEVSWGDYRTQIDSCLETVIAHKQTLNAIYERTIPSVAQLPSAMQQWRFNVQIEDPEAVIRRIFDAGLFASRHYPSVGTALGAGRFRVAESLHARILNLFNDQYFDATQAQRTGEIVATALLPGSGV